MADVRNLNRPGDTANAFRESLAYGDRTSIANELGISVNAVARMVGGYRPDPFERSRRATLLMRANANPKSEQPFLALSRDLGYVSYRTDEPGRGESFARILNETADVVNAHASAEQNGITPDERRAIARQAYELSEVARAHADEQMRLAEEPVRIGPRRSERNETVKRETA